MKREVLKSKAKEQLRGKWGLAVRTLLILTTLGSITNMLNLLEMLHLVKFDESISNWILLIYLIFQGVFTLGACKFTINLATNEEEAKFNDAVSGFDVYLKTLVLNLIIFIGMVVGFLLLAVPAIIFYTMFSQAFYILNEDKSKGIIECLKESYRIMKGHKWEYFVLVLSFMGWKILSVMTLYIGELWLNPYKQATYTNYYLELKKEN